MVWFTARFFGLKTVFVSTQSLDDESDDARPQVPARTRKALVKRKRNAEANNSPERVSNLIKLQSKGVETESNTSVYGHILQNRSKKETSTRKCVLCRIYYLILTRFAKRTNFLVYFK